jgi:hypothetical protein
MNPVIFGIKVQLDWQEKHRDEIEARSAELTAVSKNQSGLILNASYVDPKDNSEDQPFLDRIRASNDILYKTIKKITRKIEKFKGKTKSVELIGNAYKGYLARKKEKILKNQRAEAAAKKEKLESLFPVARKELKEEMTIFAAIGRIETPFLKAIARIAYYFLGIGPILDAFLDWKGGRVELDSKIQERAQNILEKQEAELEKEVNKLLEAEKKQV